jgi:RNA recognition motif-containing protein
MGIQLLIGHLSGSVTDLRLEQLFATHGSVSSAQIAIDRESGRSQGYGYGRMTSDDDARKAMVALHGRVIDGQPISISHEECAEDPAPVQPRPR